MSKLRPVVELDNVVKSYGSRRAVDGLSFEIQRGEVFALLGPNGAGKTTTVEILEGYRRRDAGIVRVLDVDPERVGGRDKARIGVMPQEGGLHPAITPREALNLFASFYPRPKSTDQVIALTGLHDAADTRYRRLSGGQRQRLSLALALLPNPELIFLDEPTAGLDPQSRRDTWRLIASLREEDATVVLTTHYLEEAERLADRVAIIDHGRLLALGPPSELVGRDSSAIRLRVGRPLEPAALAALPATQSVEGDDSSFVLLTADAPSLLVQITSLLRELDVPLLELRVGDASLEDLFLRLTGNAE